MPTAYPIRAVTVYCSSSSAVHPAYLDCAERFGRLLADTGRSLIFGAGRVGLMGAVARGCRTGGGRVVGVITERLRDAEQMDPENDENIIVRTMRERKALMEAWGDALVILPGGLGTLEEFFEVLVGRVLGEHTKPIVMVDPPDPHHPEERGYYDPLLRMIDHMVDASFMRRDAMRLLHVVRTPEGAIEELMRIEGAGPLDVNGIDDLHPALPRAAAAR
jgi:uncharacterized protein (TIGR00730 family)